MRANAPMYIQYFWRKLFSGWGFTTSPFGVSGGGSRNSGLRRNGYMKIEGKTVKDAQGWALCPSQ